MTEFLIGFNTLLRIMLYVAGGVSAVLLFAACVLAILSTAGFLFDKLTNAIARKWEKAGHVPRSKLGRVILENHKRLGH